MESDEKYTDAEGKLFEQLVDADTLAQIDSIDRKLKALKNYRL